VLAEKRRPHFLIRLFVRVFAVAFLIVGACLFVSGMVRLALEAAGFVTGLQGLLLFLSGFLLIRLRSRGLWVLALFVFVAYVRVYLSEADDFWAQFLLSLVALLVLCLLLPSYFALCRGEGRRPRRRLYFFIPVLYIVLTSLAVGAYYDEQFCAYKQADYRHKLVHFDPIEPFFHVSFPVALAQWLSFLPCYIDGNL